MTTNHTIPARGCGYRDPDSAYLEVLTGSGGTPIWKCWVDPVRLPPEGVHATNHAVLTPWGNINHVLIEVREGYPEVTDFMEEVYHFAQASLTAISRKVGPSFPFEQLTPGLSKIILVHPRAYIENWAELKRPEYCPRGNFKHLLSKEDSAWYYDKGFVKQSEQGPFSAEQIRWALIQGNKRPDGLDPLEALWTAQDRKELDNAPAAEGPCLGKNYDLLPAPEGYNPQYPVPVTRRFPLKAVQPTFEYTYVPTGETEKAVRSPGIFGIFPITRIALTKAADGSIGKTAAAIAKRLEQAAQSNQYWKDFYYHAEE